MKFDPAQYAATEPSDVADARVSGMLAACVRLDDGPLTQVPVSTRQRLARLSLARGEGAAIIGYSEAGAFVWKGLPPVLNVLNGTPLKKA